LVFEGTSPERLDIRVPTTEEVYWEKSGFDLKLRKELRIVFARPFD
jgi:hypothetical protein